jgi:hypothetical protein
MQYVHGFTYLLLGFIILLLPDLILPPCAVQAFVDLLHNLFDVTNILEPEWNMSDLSLRLDKNLVPSSSMYKKDCGALFGFLPWATPTSGEVERCLVSALGITKI